jgi:hypothetical protein
MSIQNNTKYQYIRFNDGKEIFAMVSEIDDTLELHLPMSIVTKPSKMGTGVVVNLRDIQIRTSITENYIGFYDKACTSWLDIRDNGGIEIKLAEDERESQGISIRKLLQEKIQNSIPDDFWDEYEQENMIGDYELPSKKDIIH